MIWIDWCIVGLYLVTAIGIGIWFTRRASQGTTDFFVAGRSLGWFVAGTSIVATTFAADTPVFVSGMSRNLGVSANWFWWSVLIGHVATATIFAKLWRRTEVITDVEFVQFRYGSSNTTTALRIFKSFFSGIGINCIIMAAVTLAMVKITEVLLHIDPTKLYDLGLFELHATEIVIIILGSVGLLYSAMSGLYGVVYTDIVQFVLAMGGSIGLAVLVYIDASGGEGMMAKLSASTSYSPELLQFFPRFNEISWPLFTFVIYIMMLWWAQAPGKGYTVQRLLATKSERDAKLAFLWFALLHYVLRPWPWIIVGVLSIIYFPEVADSEMVFPKMIDLFLPAGLKGIMVAAMLAAYMSTIDTHLNWGASYIINDVYQPYIQPKANPKHYVWVARVVMVVLTIATMIATKQIPSILGAFKFIGVFFSGIGTVMIARWFWWRVNAVTELTAIIATVLVATLVLLLLPDVKLGDETIDKFGLRILITTIAVAAIWIPMAFATSKTPSAAAIAFHQRMKIGGIGWKRVSAIPSELGSGLFEWVIVMAILLCMLLGTGKLLFHDWVTGGILISCAVILCIPFSYMVKKTRSNASQR